MTDSHQSQCSPHPDRPAVGECESCGSLVCGECAIRVGNIISCPLCLDKKESLETLVQKNIRITEAILAIPLAGILAGMATIYLGSALTGLFEILSSWFILKNEVLIFFGNFFIVFLCLPSFIFFFILIHRLIIKTSSNYKWTTLDFADIFGRNKVKRILRYHGAMTGAELKEMQGKKK